MQPSRVIRLGPAAFGNETACLGWQLSQVVRAIHRSMPGLDWYVADVQTVGRQFPQYSQPAPLKVGDVVTLRKFLEEVDQFESGVFAGIPGSITDPVFRDGGLWTEDEEFADLGDAEIEIRAFDTSYVSVASHNLELLKIVERRII